MPLAPKKTAQIIIDSKNDYLGLAEKVLNADGLVDTEQFKPIEVQGKLR
jgi:hypothetical protein